MSGPSQRRWRPNVPRMFENLHPTCLSFMIVIRSFAFSLLDVERHWTLTLACEWLEHLFKRQRQPSANDSIGSTDESD